MNQLTDTVYTAYVGSECGGAVKVIACIEDPVVIQKILDHLQEKAALAGLDLRPPCRAPPQLV